MNINPQAKRILCFGDSNTRGYISGSNHQRYDITGRRTGVLQHILGNDFEIIEEGLNSRTLLSEDNRPGKGGKNGYSYLIPCLDTHNPLDLIVIMLGTNELKSEFKRTATDLGSIFEEKYIKEIVGRKYESQPYTPKIIVLGIPPIDESKEYAQVRFFGRDTIIKEANEVYENISRKYSINYISTQDLITGPDGIHLTKESHQILGKMIAQKVKEIL